MSSEFLWAVTDGPAGTNAVALPGNCGSARRLDRHYSGRFWCSREAGGCGGQLIVRVGDEPRPRFHHHADVRCRFTGRESDADRAYEHLRYQRALSAWLSAQGYRPRIAKVPGQDGRTGLHVALDDVGHVVEVQLSPLSDTDWRERDDHYRSHARHVTWFYGPPAEAAATTEVAVRGVAFALRRHNVGLSVGVRDVDDHTSWVRLGACRLTTDGFHAPGAEDARARHAKRTVERRELARRVAHESARQGAPPRRAGEWAGRSSARARPWTSPLCPLPFPDEVP